MRFFKLIDWFELGFITLARPWLKFIIKGGRIVNKLDIFKQRFRPPLSMSVEGFKKVIERTSESSPPYRRVYFRKHKTRFAMALDQAD